MWPALVVDLLTLPFANQRQHPYMSISQVSGEHQRGAEATSHTGADTACPTALIAHSGSVSSSELQRSTTVGGLRMASSAAAAP